MFIRPIWITRGQVGRHLFFLKMRFKKFDDENSIFVSGSKRQSRTGVRCVGTNSYGTQSERILPATGVWPRRATTHRRRRVALVTFAQRRVERALLSDSIYTVRRAERMARSRTVVQSAVDECSSRVRPVRNGREIFRQYIRQIMWVSQ